MAIQKFSLGTTEGSSFHVEYEDTTMEVVTVLCDNPTKFRVGWSIQDSKKIFSDSRVVEKEAGEDTKVVIGVFQVKPGVSDIPDFGTLQYGFVP